MQDTVSSRRILIAIIAALAVFSAVTGAIVALFYAKDKPFRPEPTSSEAAEIYAENGVRYLGDGSAVSGFAVSGFTASAARGESASVTVTAVNETKVSIEVYYDSGKSTSSVFTPKTASGNGDAVWEWHIPKSSTTSEIRVVLRSADTYATFNITVI